MKCQSLNHSVTRQASDMKCQSLNHSVTRKASDMKFSYTALKGICHCLSDVQEDYSYYGLQGSGGM